MKIYTITTLVYLPKNNRNFTSRCWGYFPTLDEAIDNVSGDLAESLYNYLIISERLPGMGPSLVQNEMWYTYNEKSGNFDPCEKPEELRSIIGFGIG